MEEEYFPDVYCDIAIPFAVFKVILNETGDKAEDAQYVFVNDEYCKMAGIQRDQLLGRRFTEVYENAAPRWMEFCYQAGVLKQEVHSHFFSEEAGHYLEFAVKPAQKDGYVAYTFMNIDKDQLERREIEKSNRTNHAILNISKILIQKDYARSLTQAIWELSFCIYCDRIVLLSVDDDLIEEAFEWHRYGMSTVADDLKNSSFKSYCHKREEAQSAQKNIKVFDPQAFRNKEMKHYDLFKAANLRIDLNIPLYNNDTEIVGYLAIDNYEMNNLLNDQDVLRTVVYFITAKITNHKLIIEMNYLSHYDDLTGVHNRNAFNLIEDRLIKAHVPVGVIFFDVNSLKQLNDHDGHKAGDQALRQVGGLLLKYFDRDDIYRIGGDEFLVLRQNISAEDFYSQMKDVSKIVRSLSDLTIAYGGAWSADSLYLRQTMNAADQKMYQNKADYYRHHDRRRSHEKKG